MSSTEAPTLDPTASPTFDDPFTESNTTLGLGVTLFVLFCLGTAYIAFFQMIFGKPGDLVDIDDIEDEILLGDRRKLPNQAEDSSRGGVR